MGSWRLGFYKPEARASESYSFGLYAKERGCVLINPGRLLIE